MSRNDSELDSTLRPRQWEDYIGQSNLKQNLRILLDAAHGRGDAPEHILFYGPPGLGKTTLAHLVAKDLGVEIRTTSGPALERVGDIASLLTNLAPGNILFIDEVHRLNKLIEETLYPALESRKLNIVLGKGPSARMIELDLPPFTLIAATTRLALLSSPLRSRFSGGIFRLDFYAPKEIEAILDRSAKLLDLKLEPGARAEIARRSRATPRLANQLLKRCRDYSQVKKQPLSAEAVAGALDLLGLDGLGLNAHDRTILKTLITKFGGGPVGLKTLANSLAEEESTLEEVHEPYLLQLGFIERTPRGRSATPHAYKHLGLGHIQDKQSVLF